MAPSQPSTALTSPSSSSWSLRNLMENRPVVMGLVIRLGLAWFLPWFFDVRGVVPGVAYTDIDYHIFIDAANHVKAGRSPYDRHTYRYTPFLAAILAQFPGGAWGRYIFCVADVVCGWIILRYRQQKRRAATTTTDASTISSKKSAESLSNSQQPQSAGLFGWSISPQLQDALWWLYNPLAINICTRGSSESFCVLLPVLMTVTIVTNGNKSASRALLAGFWHGIAVHAKLYPIIYSLAFMTYFAPAATPSVQGFSSSSLLKQIVAFVLSWAKRLLTPSPVIFLVIFILTFVVLTYLAYYWYGQIALDEGLLYHFSRVDHRHNYSMHWYWIYLGRARTDFIQNQALIGKLLLLPQLLLLVYASLAVAPHHLGLALFLQTYLFVTQNKVITAQYLTWYLCLLPLCADGFRRTPRLIWSLLVLGLSYGLWLVSAYCLEMQGRAVHRQVWMASVVYYWANIAVIGALLDSYQKPSVGSTKLQAKKGPKSD